jgi:hypothetical protein
MKALRFFLSLVLSASLASGCAAPTAAPTLAPVSTRPAATVTARPTAMPESTPTPTITPIPAPTATPTPPLPELPELGDNVQLVQPSPEDLLDFLSVINDMDQYANSTLDTDGFYINELINQFDILNFEFETHYKDGLPDTNLLWSYYPEKYPGGRYSDAILEYLTTGLLNKINREHVRFKDGVAITQRGWRVTPRLVEIDGDDGAEWLVKCFWTYVGAITWLTLDESSSLIYTRRLEGLPKTDYIWDDEALEIVALEDFTGDRLTDVLTLTSLYLGGAYYGGFSVAKGGKQGFSIIGEIPYGYSVDMAPDQPYEIKRSSAYPWLKLITNEYRELGWDCKWNEVTTFHWAYGQEWKTVTGEQPPNSSSCIFARAMSVSEDPDNLTAIQLFEQVITTFEDADASQFAKLQMAHYRLSVLYTLEGNNNLARQHLLWFVDHYDSSLEFRENKLLPLLSKPNLSALQICSIFTNAEPNQVPKKWEDYLTRLGRPSWEPGAVGYDKYGICPINTFAN